MNHRVLRRAELQFSAGRTGENVSADEDWLLALVRRAQGRSTEVAINPEMLIRWGRLQHGQGKWENSIFLFQWATDVSPELGDGWYGLGSAYASLGSVDEAAAAYERAAAADRWLDLGPGEAYVALAELLRGQERIGEATTNYRRALNGVRFGNPRVAATAHYGLGEIALWEKNEPEQAVAHYRRALAIHPEDHWARLRLGLALNRAYGDFAAAEREIQSAIADWPDKKYLQWPYFYLAEVYELAGRRDEAIGAYERVLALDPSHRDAAARLSDLGAPD